MAKDCILTVEDEVNVKFSGLDIGTRRELSNAVKFFDVSAMHSPAYKLGRWDGYMRFCDNGGRTYVNLLDKLLPIVQNNGYLIHVDDKRAKYNISFDEINANSYSHIKWPEGHVFEGQPIVLNDHQVYAINTLFNGVQGVVIAPTGSGKTIMTAIMSHNVEPYGKSIIIVPTKDLVLQTEEDYNNFGLDVGVYYGERKEHGHKHTICTWQSLETLVKRAQKGEIGGVGISDLTSGLAAVIVDECFAKGTPVLTPNGYVPIESIQPGDTVINYSEDSNSFKEDIVVKLHTNLMHTASEKMYELTMSTGDVIKVTGNHKFLTNNRDWARADELTEEDTIISTNNVASMVRMREIKKPNETYNLHIESDHNYVVNDVVVSNCHKSKSTVLKRLLSTVFAHCPIRWGLTGTLPEKDHEKVTLTVTVGEVLGKIKTRDLQDVGILSKLHVHIKQVNDIYTKFGSYADERAYLSTDPDRIRNLSEKLITPIVEEGNTLILVDRIATGKLLAEIYPDATFVSGSMKTGDRKEAYSEVKSADDRIIIATYAVASTGININRIFNLVLLEPGKSFIKVIQSIGRGLRIAKDKDYVDVYDVASTASYSKRHLSKRIAFYEENEFPYSKAKIDIH